MSIGGFLDDVRAAWRTLRRTPGPALLSLFTLALGLAAVTTVFSFINSALLRPLPYVDAERIVALSEERGWALAGHTRISAEGVEAIRAGARSFERVGVFRERVGVVVGQTSSTPVTLTEVDAELVAIIEPRPQRGRSFERAEITGLAPLALISDALWRGRFGAREDILGQAIQLGERSYTIIGVMPPEFRFYERSDLWIPLEPPRVGETTAGERNLSALAKLRPGATVVEARREVTLLGRAYAVELAGRAAISGELERGMELVGELELDEDPTRVRREAWSEVRLVVRDGIFDRGEDVLAPFIRLLLGAAAVVLLLTSSNVASLLLARAVARRGEMAIRAALGATRGALLRQLVLENLLVAGGAALVALGLSHWGIRVVAGLVPLGNMPGWVELGLDLRSFGFAFGAAFLSVLGFGLWPALEVLRVNLNAALKASGEQGATRGSRTRQGRFAVGVELAGATLLLVAVALLGRTYLKIATVDLGYEPERIVEARVGFDKARYASPRAVLDFHQEVLANLERRPGVESVALRGSYSGLVLEASGPAGDAAADAAGVGVAAGPGAAASSAAAAEHFGIYRAEDREQPVSGLRPAPSARVVSDGFFRTLGLRLVAGRGFGPDDHAGSTPVAVISKRLARYLWEGADPLGRVLTLRPGGPPVVVVGVASDLRVAGSHRRGLSVDALPDLFLSERQAVAGQPELLVRVPLELARQGDLAPTRLALVEAVRMVDPTQAVVRAESLAELARGTVVLRPIGLLLAAFALVALVLALVGIYGVISYTVARRTREFGVRLALGAAPASITLLVLRGGVTTIGTGIGAGLLGAALLTVALRPFIWGVSRLDPLTYLAVAVLLGGAGVAACLIPARRAMRIPAAVALREE